MNKYKGYTPIQHRVLHDCFCLGLLTKDEMRISLWIIRWSWGFDDKKNDRRQDWTKPRSDAAIASEILMDKAHFSRVIRSLVARNIIMIRQQKHIRGNQYQFNEHIERWKSSDNSQTKSNSKNSDCKIYSKKLQNIQRKVAEYTTERQFNINNNNDLAGSKKTLNKNKKNRCCFDQQQAHESDEQKQLIVFIEGIKNKERK